MSDNRRWHISIAIEPDREWEGIVVARCVDTAVSMAIFAASLQAGELIHFIHVGPPKDA